MTALEARLDGGSFSANPCSLFAPSRGYLKLLMSAEEISFKILPTTVNLPEHGALPIEANLPAYPTLSDYQAVLNIFSSQSSQVGYVAEVAELMSPNWVGLVDI